jgi:hypothetical protein
MENASNVPLRFRPGSICVTARVAEELSPDAIRTFLRRHLSGDWGKLCTEDRQANEDALKCGTRLLSAYVLDTREKLYVITDADRSATTVLFADEY